MKFLAPPVGILAATLAWSLVLAAYKFDEPTKSILVGAALIISFAAGIIAGKLLQL